MKRISNTSISASLTLFFPIALFGNVMRSVIANLLLSLTVKEFSKIGKHLAKLRTRLWRLVF